jgi:ribosomal protein S11
VDDIDFAATAVNGENPGSASKDALICDVADIEITLRGPQRDAQAACRDDDFKVAADMQIQRIEALIQRLMRVLG